MPYPDNLTAFVTREDGTVVYAQHMNYVQAAVGRIETTLGLLPQGAAASVAARIAALESGKSATDHGHSDLVPKSLIDAKGDVLAGTADNTLGRVTAAAANNHALMSDAAQSAGVRFRQINHNTDLGGLTTGDPHTQYNTPARHALIDHSGMPGVPANPFPGMLVAAARDTVPSSAWLVCDGSLVSRTTYSALFNAIGTQFGAGDGSTTFQLPDLRGRLPVGKDSGTFNALGLTGGAAAVALTTAQTPSHDHGGTGSAGNHNHGGDTGNQTSSHTHSGTTSSYTHSHSISGGSGTHDHAIGTAGAGSAHTHRNSNTATKVATDADTGGLSNTSSNPNPIQTGGGHSHTPGSDTHNHAFTTGGQSSSHDHVIATQASHAHTIASVGSGQSHENMPPYLVVRWFIYTGVVPAGTGGLSTSIEDVSGATYTVTEDDDGKVLRFLDNCTVSLPTGVSIGARVVLLAANASGITVQADGSTVNGDAGAVVQHDRADVLAVATDTWNVKV